MGVKYHREPYESQVRRYEQGRDGVTPYEARPAHRSDPSGARFGEDESRVIGVILTLAVIVAGAAVVISQAHLWLVHHGYLALAMGPR